MSSACSRSTPSKRLVSARWISGRLCDSSSVATAPGSTSETRDVAAGDLLAQRLAERADAVLGQVVDAAAAAGDAARDRADVDHVGDAARSALGGARAGGGARRGRSTAAPSTLIATIRSHSSSGAPTAGPSSITPALLISVSSRPSSATVRSTAAWPARGSVTSALDRERACRRDRRSSAGERLEPIGAACGDRDGRARRGERHAPSPRRCRSTRR